MVGMYSEKLNCWAEVGGWKLATGECSSAWAASLALSVVTTAESLREGYGERKLRTGPGAWGNWKLHQRLGAGLQG